MSSKGVSIRRTRSQEAQTPSLRKWDGWVMRVGELLRPITAAMGQELLKGDYIQADEPRVDVEMHDGRGETIKPAWPCPGWAIFQPVESACAGPTAWADRNQLANPAALAYSNTHVSP
jgi:hypothetical protein